MSNRKISSSLALLLLLSPIALAASVQDSVVSRIETIEDIASLNHKKYTKNQFDEISSALQQKQNRIRLVTFNMLRGDLDEQQAPVNRWKQRLPRVVAAIREMDPDAIGVQELVQTQLGSLMEELGDEYGYYGKPRLDGECNGIFYRKDRFELGEHQVVKIPGIDKDQLLTLLELKDSRTGKVFAIYNIHMSFSNIQCREIEARYIAELIRSHQVPVLLTGDLNTFPNRPDAEAFPFYDGDYIHRILTQNDLKDSQEVSLLGHVGPISTFTNRPPSKAPFEGTGTPGVVLDHIYVSEGISVLVHATEPVRVDGHYPSDHMPVLIDFLLD